MCSELNGERELLVEHFEDLRQKQLFSQLFKNLLAIDLPNNLLYSSVVNFLVCTVSKQLIKIQKAWNSEHQHTGNNDPPSIGISG